MTNSNQATKTVASSLTKGIAPRLTNKTVDTTPSRGHTARGNPTRNTSIIYPTVNRKVTEAPKTFQKYVTDMVMLAVANEFDAQGLCWSSDGHTDFKAAVQAAVYDMVGDDLLVEPREVTGTWDKLAITG